MTDSLTHTVPASGHAASPVAVPPVPAGLGDAGADIAGVMDESDLRDLVAGIREQVNTATDAGRQNGLPVAEDTRAALGEEITADWLRRQTQDRIRHGYPSLPGAFVDRLRADVRAALSPLGAMTRYLDTGLWSDVEVNGDLNVVCTRRDTGTRHEFASPFATDTAAWDWAAEHAAKAGRRFDESNPSARFRLANGVRVHAIGRITSRTHLSFRLFQPGLDTLGGLCDAGMFGPDLLAVLTASAAVREPIGVIFAGGTGNGKTTLLRSWLNAHPDPMVLGRIVTVEDEMELFLDRARFRNLVEFEARESNVDGKGEYSMERYLSHDLRRQTPERVGLGELKPDGGVVPLLLAVGQGIAQGVATTIHAPSAPDVLTRIRTYAAFGERQLPERTVMETVAASVDLVVHTTRIAGRRVVASVYEYADFRDGTVTSAELWRYHPDAGRAVRTDLEITDTLTAKLTAAGLDANILDRDPSQARR